MGKKNKKNIQLDESNKADVKLITNDQIDATRNELHSDRLSELGDTIFNIKEENLNAKVTNEKEEVINVGESNNNAINNDNSKSTMLAVPEEKCKFWQNLSSTNKAMCVCNTICCSFLFILICYTLFINK